MFWQACWFRCADRALTRVPAACTAAWVTAGRRCFVECAERIRHDTERYADAAADSAETIYNSENMVINRSKRVVI